MKRPGSWTIFRLVMPAIGLLPASGTSGCAAGPEPSGAGRPVPVDVLVVAPHSDDEAIGCTAVIMRAFQAKQRVAVVIVTAGDGFPKAAAAAAKKDVDRLAADDFLRLAALRQRHSLKAMKELGVGGDDLMFLGYPDGGLKPMFDDTDGLPYRQPHTGKAATYGVEIADHHSQVHGRTAPYVRASLLADLTEIIAARRPKEIYVTGEADTHNDHSMTFRFVREAAKAARFEGTLWTFVVHGKPPAEPPGRRLTLTDAELKAKRALLELYQAGVSPVHDDLAATYTKPHEDFWPVRVGSEKGK